MPIGMPGCPEFAACTASIESALMALAIWTMRAVARLMGFILRKLGRFDAREAFAERRREVNPPRPRCTARSRLIPLINSAGQTFALAQQSW
ncbi:MAG TPA: hypothetical protein DCM66_02675 [Erythrobacter sp.]|jgi:hypothetical protein|nr:hypothetical protein [Erythrobacter sp.]